MRWSFCLEAVPVGKKRIKAPENKELVWDPGEANEKQRLFYASRCTYTLYGGAKGGGKSLTVDTPICTPFGWKRMGDVKVGDTVIGRDGGHTKVIGVYPQGVLPIYRVTFIDGASVECSADHLWTAKRTARHGGWKVYTTAMLRELLDQEGSNLLIPLCDPVRFTRGKSGGKIRPYTLGVLLGDGSTTNAASISVTSDDGELFRHIEEDGYHIVPWSSNRNLRYGFNDFKEEREYIRQHKLDCRAENKHIPEGYKYAPVEDRYAILQGLMDTDGYADDRGHCEFCSTSRRLAEDVQFLVRSLGGKAALRRKETYCYTEGYEGPGQDAYIVYIQTKDNEKLFRLERKRARCRGKQFNGGISELCRRIVNIEPCGEAECQCIAVDNTDSLYVTKDFVVTHNTHSVRIKAVGGALANPGIKILIMRRTYGELEQNHIHPILKMVPNGVSRYNATSHLLTFYNGSSIKFGHWSGEQSEDEYNGLEWDWIFIDEATQFTERTFNFLGGCLRGTNGIPKRMYLTANPGGVGHR